MANLSNINNKFIVTDGGDVMINNTIAGYPNGEGLTIKSSDNICRVVLQNSVSGGSVNDGFRIGLVNSNVEFESTESGEFQFYTGGGAAKMTIDSSGNASFAGNVNISSPGDLYINSGTSYNNVGSVFMSNQRTEISSIIVDATAQGDTALNFKTRSAGSTASAMFINEFRRVGIGELAPLKPLHVKAPDAAGNIRLTRAGTSEYKDIGTYYTYTNGNSAGFGTTSANKTFLTTNTYNALEINSSQEVSLLGFVGGDGFALPHDENTGYSNFSAGGFGILFREAADNYIMGNAYYYRTGGVSQWKAKYATGATMIASNVGEITFQTATSVAAGATLSFDSKMVIKNDGKVGIGNTSPRDKLTIFTPGSAEEEIALRLVNPIGFTNAGSGSSIIFAQDRNTGENIPMAKIRNSQSAAGTSCCGELIFSTAHSSFGGMIDKIQISSNGSTTFKGAERPQIYLNSRYDYPNNPTFEANTFAIVAAKYIGSSPFEANRIIAVNSTHLAFEAGNAERMRINSSGNMQMANGSMIFLGSLSNTGNNWNFNSYSNGQLYLQQSATSNLGVFDGTSGTYTAMSDVNKKKDFEDSKIGLKEVMGLQPKLYRMKKDTKKSEKLLGFIAQEVKEYIPQAYVENGADDNKFIGLNQMPIIAALTKAIQELKAEIELLKNK